LSLPNKKIHEEKTSNVIVVDIDEKSLNSLGQWPWPRILMAKIVHKINSYHPNAIALDIMFSEKDRTSPKEIESFYKNFFNIQSSFKGMPKSLYDNDLIFSSALFKSNSVIGFYLSENSVSDKMCKELNSLDINLNNFEIENFDYLLCNTNSLNSNYSGFVNTYIDDDGILRRMPLFRTYKEVVVPTLSLATLLSINDDLKNIDYRSFEILNHKVITDKKSNILLNFYDKSWYKKVSVVDLLNNKIPKSMLNGKIILIGSSATSLHDQIIISGGEKIIGVKVHVTMIDNILNEEFLVQPEYYKSINIVLSLLMSFLLLYLLINKYKKLTLATVIIILILASAITTLMFYDGIYISISYFLIPFLLHLFFISFIYIIIDTYDKYLFKEELNRLHIADLDQKIKEKTADLVQTHKHIQENINYASLIQNSLLPKENIIENYTKESLIFWQPRDIVGGDIYLITELKSKNEILVMVIDGAGHGVSGAFITVIVKAIEIQIVSEIDNGTMQASPALILEYFNRSIKTMLKQEKNSKSNVGFDGGVLYYNKETNICKYAGAKTPLYILNGEDIEILKTDRKNVGYIRTKIDQKYTEYTIEVKDWTTLYISTDGIYDQEGENDTRYSKKKFEELIQSIYKKSLNKQKKDIILSFEKFKIDFEQSDDITVIGLKF